MKQQKTSRKLEAVILDMDGVITQTAKIHNEAWKQMFNVFLEEQSDNQEPMNDEDYIRYLDGKPRYKGVESFLGSREIELPYGNPDDAPDKKTVCGLGNRKNEIYTGLLKKRGAETYDDAVKKIRSWKENGLKTAVVTSSKNGKLVLETAGIEDLFDVRIDGITAQKRELKGKPNPDIFVEATKELDVSPEISALFEDAISGVQSGSNGNFALVVGVARNENRKELSENGADVVIESFENFDLLNDEELQEHFANPAPPLSDEFSKIEQAMDNRIPVLFLDYDGTLTPIVNRPEAAVISDEMKEMLKKCADKFKVAAVSGRDMDDLKDKIKLKNLIYAGSHGFRISGPDDLYKEHEKTNEILPKLDKMQKTLEKDFPEIDDGIQVERKRYAIAVHYRNASESSVPEIKKEVNKVLENHPGFKTGEGKKIVEIKPDVDWHKGKAVNWILEELNASDTNKYVPIYIGDDITDEDAFEAIKDSGIGILVGYHGSSTNAKYRLKNVYQVRVFLQKLAESV